MTSRNYDFVIQDALIRTLKRQKKMLQGELVIATQKMLSLKMYAQGICKSLTSLSPKSGLTETSILVNIEKLISRDYISHPEPQVLVYKP